MAERDGDRLGQRLAAIRARHPGSEPEMVADVVHAVLATMSGDLSAQETSLLAEVEALGNTIASRQGGDCRAAVRRHHRQPYPVRDR